MRFEFAPTFGEQYRATLAVQRHSALQLVAGAIFPLMGISIFVLTVAFEKRLPTPYEWFIIAISLGFTPLVSAFTVWMYRRRNRLTQGVHAIELASDGLHISAPAFDTTIRYTGIRRIVETKHFVLLFFSAYGAQYIPKRVIGEEQLPAVRELLHRSIKA